MHVKYLAKQKLSSIHPTTKERSYATSAYYNPIKDRTNLEVLTNATVEKTLFDVTKATGVQYRHNGRIETVVASKETILAASVFQSPKILELSGIGDKSILHSYEIELVKDLPRVGENLQDHLICGISFKTVDGLETLDPLVRQEPEALRRAMEDYASSQSGLLTSIGINTYAYLPMVEHLSEESQKTTKQLLSRRCPSGDSPHDARARSYYEVVENPLLDPNEPSAAYLSVLGQQVLPIDPDSDSPSGPVPGGLLMLGVMLSQPLFRGSVHTTSKDPLATPIIDPKYLSNPVDIEVYARHMTYLETIAASSPLNNLLKQPLTRRDPASHLTDIEKAKKYVRTSAISIWHLGGTCVMLPEEKGGVLNPKLKVYGVDNLCVVDSSAIPLIGTANLQSTVYALAERAADLPIKQGHGLH
ncbi:hypothetical protein F4776DRAFT_675141 [Hypoxylon sp. NC0597]|nr:hypothetical protein F4776DRAFT_675141 [Hypoxylon sp. NC0597]